MSKPVFIWLPDIGSQRSITSTVVATKFGEGYEQRTANGINFIPKIWQLTFTTNSAHGTDILNFLDARGGLESFSWTDPLNKTATYICREWHGLQQAFGVYSITCSFEQVWEQ